MKKLVGIVFIPGLLMALIFITLGDSFEAAYSRNQFTQNYNPQNAWLMAIALMVSDLLLPIPASGIMSAVGSIYGLFTGFIINFSGTFLSGILAYGLARTFGEKGIKLICSQKEVTQYKDFFDKWGGMAIISSRLFPILPEVMALAAGLNKMKFSKFSTALFLGSLAVSSLYT